MRRRAASSAAVLLLLLFAASCSGDDAAERARGGGPVVGGTLRMGIERLPSLDPAQASPSSVSASITADLLYDTVPDLAASPGESPDGGTTWRYVLAEGAGVTSTDVEASLERLPGIDVVVVDERSFDVTGAGPDVLSLPAYGVVPAEFVASGDWLAAAAAGTGPFRLAAVDGDVLRLARAPDGTARLDAVELHQFDSTAASYEAFQAGALDWSQVPPERAEEAAERYGTEGFVPSATVLVLTAADPAVRQAVAAVVDAEAIVDAVFLGVADPIEISQPELVPVEVTVDDGTTETDAALARVLAAQLTAAGVPATVEDGGAVRAVTVVDPVPEDAVPVARFRTLTVAAEGVQELQLQPTGTFDPESTWLD